MESDLGLNPDSTLYLVRSLQQIIYLSLNFIDGNKERTVPSSAQLEAGMTQVCQVPGLEPNTWDTLNQDLLYNLRGPVQNKNVGFLFRIIKNLKTAIAER